MSDRPPEAAEPDPDDDDDRPPDADTPARSPEPQGAALLGPAFGILLGLLVIRFLPHSTPFLVRLLIAIVVIAVTTYAVLEITRRRARR